VDAFGPTARHAAFRTALRDGARERIARELTPAADGMLRVRMRATTAAEVSVELAVTLSDGSAWGTTVRATSGGSVIDVPLRSLTRVPLVLIPRPYPTFLPYDLLSGARVPTALDLLAIEGVQWGFARGTTMPDEGAMRVEIESVELHLRRTP